MKLKPTDVLVIESGWVLAGEVADKGDFYEVSNSAVIRTWGTSRGLGQLCATGPTSETKLDPCGQALVPKSKLLFKLAVTFAGEWDAS